MFQTFKTIFIQIDKHMREILKYMWWTPVRGCWGLRSGPQESTAPQFRTHCFIACHNSQSHNMSTMLCQNATPAWALVTPQIERKLGWDHILFCWLFFLNAHTFLWLHTEWKCNSRHLFKALLFLNVVTVATLP